ncbi:endocuticle structural glycoprotein bd-8-like protein [Lasius niger]|uniref:Endocuticle structural glycoprotein bd-8-like protein n=1 Tax=Lasius niger TaxID=67767 RepID=A0A0J7L9L8_LASNI|nr:endocuticle structural glycoprotein bd-8-like protein [Lasius niger]
MNDSQSQEGPNPDGSYKWNYEAGNGIKAEEEGHVEDAGTENEAMTAEGGFSYSSDDGQAISLTYKADRNGFQPVGAHLPTTPEIPPLIQKALEWIAAHPSKDDENQSQENPNPDGSYKSSYEAGNGTKAEKKDHLEDAGIEDVGIKTSMGIRTTSEIPPLIKGIIDWRAVPFG